MSEPTRHSYVKVNDSFVHLVQYGQGENILRTSLRCSPNNSFTSTNSTNCSATDNQSASISKNQSTTTRTRSSNGTQNHTDGNNNSENLDPLRFNNTSSSNSSRPANGNTLNAVRKLIVFIPGNPGMLGVYHDFLSALSRIVSRPVITASKSSSGGAKNSNTSQHPTILAISHNNFDHPDTEFGYQAQTRVSIDKEELNFLERSLGEEYEPHHVELQVVNKMIILKKMLNCELKDCQIIFIGHSIGCYVILRLIQDKIISQAHCGTIMLHPALENLALTEKGSLTSKYFSFRLDLVAQSIAYVLDKLVPKPIKLTLVRWYCSSDFVEASSDEVLDSFAQIVSWPTMKALLQMAKSEFESVKGLNHEILIKPHVNQLRLIYALEDHWVNPDHRRELGELYPDLYIEEQPTMHAFVMEPKTVVDYAVKVGILIKDLFEQTEI